MNARLLGGVALAAALALPSAASAATTLTAGPVKVKGGYQMTLIANDAKKDTLTVMLGKSGGKDLQQHMYTFDAGVKNTARSIDAKLGRYGSIKLALGNATSGTSALPKGCKGKPGKTLKGTLSGSVKFVADRTYFKTIKASSLPGQSFKAGKIDCSGTGGNPGQTPGGAGGATLTVSGQLDGGSLSFTATKGTQSAFVMEAAAKAAPASVMHFITAEAPASAFEVAGNLSSATVKGEAPFLTGTGTFEGEGAGSSATGTLSGSLAANFDSIGKVSLTGDDLIASIFKR